MLRRGLMLVAASALVMAAATPAQAVWRLDPNDASVDRYDIAASSLTVVRSEGVRWMTVTIRTYEAYKIREGEGWFKLRLDTWGAGKADFEMTMFGDPASGGATYAPIGSLHGTWGNYARIDKVGPRTLKAWFPVHWVHPNKAVRWYLRALVPGPVWGPETTSEDRAPNAGWYGV